MLSFGGEKLLHITRQPLVRERILGKITQTGTQRAATCHRRTNIEVQKVGHVPLPSPPIGREQQANQFWPKCQPYDRHTRSPEHLHGQMRRRRTSMSSPAGMRLSVEMRLNRDLPSAYLPPSTAGHARPCIARRAPKGGCRTDLDHLQLGDGMPNKAKGAR